MKRSCLALLLILGTSCRPQAAPETHASPVPVQRLTPGGTPAQNSGLRFATRTVVEDAATFDKLWRQAFADAPAPQVDWARQKVVFAALGDRPSGGYSIVVSSAEQAGDELTITVDTITPGPGCMNAEVLTQPVDVVSIPRPAAGVLIRFRERTGTQTCP